MARNEKNLSDAVSVSRRGFLRICGVGFLCLTPLLGGCDHRNRGNNQMETTKSNEERVVRRKGSRPPIDLSIPDRVETATFALG
jgi:hypothetical protein